MKYRKFGRHELQVSVLGFGAMRLPTYGDVRKSDRLSENIVEDEAIKMIRFSIDQGVNYIDTAYSYHKGNSEIVVGKALKDGYRDKTMLATKSPVWLIEKSEDFERLLDEQLKKLQTEHIDFYLLHALSEKRWKQLQKLDILKQAEAAKQAGKIKYIGFSFHDELDVFTEIIDSYDNWDFCQIQLNYMDVNYQAGLKGLKYAASKGLGIVIMEPLLGGRLANPPADIKKLFQYKTEWTPATWALHWLWSMPEISVVLSGMSNMEQLSENIISAKNSEVGLLSDKEYEIIDHVRHRLEGRAAIPCTECNYCMPCPNNVDIPGNFELYNQAVIYEDIEAARIKYNHFFDEEIRAEECIQCRLCEEKCPQNIDIADWMVKVHERLGQN